MALELDHVFICVDDAPAAERALTGAGVQIGLRAIHSGQGTANACAFFDNAYLELLSLHNDTDLRSEAVRPLRLQERLRWRQTNASPFGIALRLGNVAPHVETWSYNAPFLPRAQTIPIVTPPNSAEVPLMFLIPAALPIRLQSPVEHRGKHRRITRVTVSGPGVSDLEEPVATLCASGLVVLKPATEHHLQLDWDGATAGERHDFRPVLALTIRW